LGEAAGGIAGMVEGLAEGRRNCLWMLGLVEVLEAVHIRHLMMCILVVLLEGFGTSPLAVECAVVAVAEGCSIYCLTALVADAPPVKSLTQIARRP
jgi:hypothetical protein